MSGARPRDAGLVSGLFNTTAQVGAAAGAAVLSTLAAGRTAHLLRSGRSQADALNGGYHVAFLIGVGLLAAALVVAAVVLRGVGRGAEGGDEPAVTDEAPVPLAATAEASATL